MNRGKLKVLYTVATLALVGGFSHAHAWAPGDCLSGSPLCIDHTPNGGVNWYYIDGSAYNGIWYGDINGNPFPFSGAVNLNCPVAGIEDLNCLVSLNGELKKNSESNVSVRVVSGSVSQLPAPDNNPQCDDVSISIPPFWYFDDGHDFSNGGGVSVSSGSPIVGNFGVIDFSVGSLSISGHIHDVEFSNNGRSIGSSAFNFNSDIYIRPLGFDVSTGCHIEGDLNIDSPYDANIYPAP